MSERRAILIANPRTGRYGARPPLKIESLCADLRKQNIAVELVWTTSPGDAARISAQAAADGFGEVIVSGGDGTINEAVQGLIGTKTRLGILPRGTGNVLARDLKIPLNVRRALEVIAQGRTRKVFPGCATDEASGARRYFLLMAGIGLDAEVIKRVPPALKKRIGKAAFWFSGLSFLPGWKPASFQIEINGRIYRPTFAAIGKAASYGGDFAVTPRARIDQPEFEICLIESHSKLRYLRLLSHTMRGGMPLDKRGIRFLQATRARAKGRAAVQVDGELLGKLPMSFEVAPQTIEVIVP